MKRKTRRPLPFHYNFENRSSSACERQEAYHNLRLPSHITPALRPKITRMRRADKVLRSYHLAADAR